MDDKDKQAEREPTVSSTMKQITLKESSSQTKVWEVNDPRAVKLSTKVAEMIATDCQPLSIVDNIGFVRLMKAAEPRYMLPSRRHITETVIPQVHSRVLSQAKESISEAKRVSCTSDIWSTDVSNDSLISLTARTLAVTKF